jgi:hypothetical protein
MRSSYSQFSNAQFISEGTKNQLQFELTLNLIFSNRFLGSFFYILYLIIVKKGLVNTFILLFNLLIQLTSFPFTCFNKNAINISICIKHISLRFYEPD